MTPEEINIECIAEYNKIKEAEARLDELRSICEHKETFKGDYSFRVGQTERALICFHCGKYISPIIKVTYVMP